MTSSLTKIKNALTSVEGLKVYHYFRSRLTAPYCIWAEDQSDDLQLNNGIRERSYSGTIDYYTKTELDPITDKIEEALNAHDGIAYYLNSVQYDDETATIHFEWVFKVA